MTNAAEDIAKATGTNFGKDALGLIMEKYDKGKPRGSNAMCSPHSVCCLLDSRRSSRL